MDEYISKQRAKDLMGCCLASAKAEYKAAKDEFTKARFGDYISAIQSMIDVVGSVEAADHRQLAEWLTELKEAKRLLKLAVEDFKEINSDILTCKYCKWYSAETDECTFYPDDTPCEKICGWKHEGEALKLIGETNDEP